jgi:GcrA cell cycle regulator
MSFYWTREQDEVVIRMWPTGASSREIAEELGGGRTRNMVIGRARRLKLAEKQPPRPGAGKPPGPHAPRKPRSRTRIKVGGRGWNHGVREFEAEPMPPPDVDDQAIPLEQRCTIAQLTNQTCRWIVGHPDDPAHFYCGALEANFAIGLPYCRGHHARAFNGPPPPPRPFIPRRSSRA